jgi:hypothetical protein
MFRASIFWTTQRHGGSCGFRLRRCLFPRSGRCTTASRGGEPREARGVNPHSQSHATTRGKATQHKGEQCKTVAAVRKYSKAYQRRRNCLLSPGHGKRFGLLDHYPHEDELAEQYSKFGSTRHHHLSAAGWPDRRGGEAYAPSLLSYSLCACSYLEGIIARERGAGPAGQRRGERCKRISRHGIEKRKQIANGRRRSHGHRHSSSPSTRR